jgi:hypothetical protein
MPRPQARRKIALAAGYDKTTKEIRIKITITIKIEIKKEIKMVTSLVAA